MAKTVKISTDGKWLLLGFGFGRERESCKKLMMSKDADGKRFASWDGSVWKRPYSDENLTWLKNHGWKLVGEALLKGEAITANDKDYKKDAIKYDKSLLHKDLRHYQVEAIDFIMGNGGKGIVGACMGSGKSNIATNVFKILPHDSSTLIVCPAGLKVKWQRELKKWGNLDSIILSGRTPNVRINPNNKIYIINYEILQYWATMFIGMIDVVCADEAHKLSNKTAKWTKNFMVYFSHLKHLMFLTGTPAKSKVRELYNMLHMLAPNTFNNEDLFLRRYCGPEMTGRGLTYDGSSNEEELHQLLKPLMIRFDKEQILPELPSKNIIIEEVDAEDVDFKKAEKDWVKLKKEYGEDSKEARKGYALLSRSAYALKRDYIHESIREILEEGKKLVVGAWHIAVIDDLLETFPDALVLDGRVDPSQRQEIEDRFQKNPDCKLIIGQLQAAGEGFEFTASEDMLFAEIWSVPSVMQQFMDRIHRLTSKGKQVNYYFPVVVDSIEEDILETLNSRVSSLGKVLDGVDGKKFI